MKTAIYTRNAPAAVGPYSQAVRAGQVVYVSGQLPLDPTTGEVVTGSIQIQTERVLENIRAILTAAGLGMEHVVRTTIYLTDLGHFPTVNTVYARYFTEPYPARVTVQVAALPRGVDIEIDATAVVP